MPKRNIFIFSIKIHYESATKKGKELDLTAPESNALFDELALVRCVLFTAIG